MSWGSHGMSLLGSGGLGYTPVGLSVNHRLRERSASSVPWGRHRGGSVSSVSGWCTETAERYVYEPANGGFGRKVAPCREGVEAKAGELVEGDVVSNHARCGGLGKDLGDQVPDALLCVGDVLTSMQKRRDLGAGSWKAPAMASRELVVNERVGL